MRTKSVTCRDLIEHLIGKENADSFEIWAFGDLALNQDAFKLARQWNNIHKNLHKITFDSPIEEDLVIMIDLWKETQKD